MLVRREKMKTAVQLVHKCTFRSFQRKCEAKLPKMERAPSKYGHVESKSSNQLTSSYVPRLVVELITSHSPLFSSPPTLFFFFCFSLFLVNTIVEYLINKITTSYTNTHSCKRATSAIEIRF